MMLCNSRFLFDIRWGLFSVLFLVGSGRAEPPATSRIVDEEISAALNAQGIRPVERARPTDLVRRIYLDVLGRIPTPSETANYLNDRQPDKHHRLIDELLTYEEMPVHWARVWDEWLCGDVRERGFGREGFLDYLEQSLRQNTPWDQMARELITPDLTVDHQRGAAYFLAARLRKGDQAAKLDSMTGGVSRMFFGVQLQCAKCHDHPFVDQWRQEHYYGLAAFFGRTQEARYKNWPIVKERADGEVKFTTTAQKEKTAELMFLDGKLFEEPPRPDDRKNWYTKGKDGLPDVPFFSRRGVLADYAFTADSALFKRAIVNRMWKKLMGRGLVEPVDQMHEANPPTHPELLHRLAEDFAEHGFDLNRLMAGLLHSEAYLRSSRWRGEGEVPRDRDYALALLKPLTPDQLVLSISIATGHYDRMQAKFAREKQKRKLDEITPAMGRALYFQDRGVRQFTERFQENGEDFQANASQALFLSYNSLMTKQLEAGQGNLVARLSQQDSDAQTIEDTFLAVLSRSPTPEELARMKRHLATAETPRVRLCQEMVWALLCSGEFRFNH